MPLLLLLFSAGVLSVGLFPSLPNVYWCLSLIPLFFLLFFIRRFFPNLKFFLAVCLGFAVGVVSGHQIMSHQLVSSDSGQEFILTGYISGLPKQESRQLRFVVDVESLKRADQSTSSSLPQQSNKPQKIQLSWYLSRYQTLPQLQIGDLWQWRVKLQRPRSMVNPAGFDYQVWLMRKGIGATGYVVKGNTQQMESPRINSVARWVDKQRFQLQQWILSHSDSAQRGILIALLIGDTAKVEKEDWNAMQKTGTNHLIAISGMHIGFLALFGYYFGLLFGRVLQFTRIPWPAQYFAFIGAITFASFYSALAGFNIPTVRTLIMLSVFYWVCLWRRETHVLNILCLALTLVVIIDPLAGYDMGFWLSFGAVSLLILFFSGRVRPKQSEISFLQKCRNNIWVYIQSQWVMFIGLLVPLLIFIYSVALSAPVANAIAIPLVTFFVVPCLLLAASLHNIIPGLSDFLLNLAGSGLEYLLQFLHYLLNISPGNLNPLISLSPAMSCLMGFCALLILLPSGFFPRALSITTLIGLLLINQIYPKPDQPDLRILVLDVGQGTAVVITAKDKTLVYDTGAIFSDNFDAGSGIVAPYLRSKGIRKLDKLVISHNDQDHAGGLEGVLDNLEVHQLYLGQYLPLFVPNKTQQRLYRKAASVESCHQAAPWAWGEVSFRFLHWPLRTRASANNYSCLLMVEYRGHQIMLPGDLEKEVEAQLLDSGDLPQHIQLLLAGHHGSSTSSTRAFVDYVAPEQVVYSAGYHNRYGHPHPSVRSRFQAIGSHEFNTATDGAIEFTWKDGVALPPRVYRQVYKHYWFVDE